MMGRSNNPPFASNLALQRRDCEVGPISNHSGALGRFSSTMTTMAGRTSWSLATIFRTASRDVAADYLGLPNKGAAKPKLYHNNRDGTFTD